MYVRVRKELVFFLSDHVSSSTVHECSLRRIRWWPGELASALLPLGKRLVDIPGRGKGTTLEDVYNMNIATPIWSSQAIEENPDVLIDAHLSFLRAGARVLDTATCVVAHCSSAT